MQNKVRDQLAHRIQSEYLEMPGLRLTHEQAQRLWALDNETCTAILEALVEIKFLVCGSDGRYKRITEGSEATPSPRMVKADFTPVKTSRTHSGS